MSSPIDTTYMEWLKFFFDERGRHAEMQPTLRCSDAPKCGRQIAYKVFGFPSTPINWRGQMVFQFGDRVEDCVVTPGVEEQVVRDVQKEVSFLVNGTKIYGHIDGIYTKALPNGEEVDILLEVKSTTTFGGRRAAKHDIADFLPQLNVYMHCLDLTRAEILFCVKETCQMYEVQVAYDDNIFQKVKSKFARVLAAETPEDVKRDYGPNKDGKLPWQCSYCGFNKHCWPNYELSFDQKTGKPSLKVRGDEDKRAT